MIPNKLYCRTPTVHELPRLLTRLSAPFANPPGAAKAPPGPRPGTPLIGISRPLEVHLDPNLIATNRHLINVSQRLRRPSRDRSGPFAGYCTQASQPNPSIEDKVTLWKLQIRVAACFGRGRRFCLLPTYLKSRANISTLKFCMPWHAM